MYKAFFVTIFLIVVLGALLYYQLNYYSFANFLVDFSYILLLPLFLLFALLEKNYIKPLLVATFTSIGIGIIIKIILFFFIKVEIFNIENRDKIYYFKFKNFEGSYLYNPNQKCIQYQWYINDSFTIPIKSNKKYIFISKNPDVNFIPKGLLKFEYKKDKDNVIYSKCN